MNTIPFDCTSQLHYTSDYAKTNRILSNKHSSLISHALEFRQCRKVTTPQAMFVKKKHGRWRCDRGSLDDGPLLHS